MRKLPILLTASLLASVTSMQAQWRTADEALQIARESKLSANDGRRQSPASNPRLAYTLRGSKTEKSLLYGVNYENGGFALVSGCEYTPAILGYADHGTLPSDIKEMPEGLSYMLGVYEQQLEYAASHMHKTAKTRTTSQNADIEPLLETKWNQGEPYNRYCPNNYPAGCVAVAMAQTMRYHQWPNQGTGSHNGYDFSQHTWNWNNMLPSYSSGNYSEEQADEVATLIRQLGASVDMEYAEGGSGATSVSMLNSLQQYWKYDDGMSLAIRSNYSDSEWMQLLYNELNAGRPVPYDGRGEDSGHSFLLDGYKQGFFHVNWGWGGYCDGYFMINNLVPLPDIEPKEYVYDQSAFLGIRPEIDGKAAARLESWGAWSLSSSSVSLSEDLYVTGAVTCTSLNSFDGKIGVKITDLETQVQTSSLNTPVNGLQFNYYSTVRVPITTSGLTTNHSYKVELVYQPTGSNDVVTLPVPVSQPTLAFKVGSSDSSPELYPRRTVVEEGTGTWCPWCVSGIVGMEYMARTYPDNFIGIAVHSGDEMDYEEGYGLEYTSFPSAYFNRSMKIDPIDHKMEYNLKNKSGLTTNAMVKVTSLCYSDDQTQLTVASTTRFAFDQSGADYRLAYVITEDNVGPYWQANGYSSGEWGEMGGFENLPSWTSVIYNDVARGIYPSHDGVEGSVPATIVSCTDYEYEYTIPVPRNCDDYSNLKLTILLYDAKTGEIVNADRVVLPEGKDIKETIVEITTPGTLAELLGDIIWDIVELTVKGPINGEDLMTLRQMAGCGETLDDEDDIHFSLKKLNLQDAQIVKGGIYMYECSFAPQLSLEEDDILPKNIFNNSCLRMLITPKSLKRIDDQAFDNCDFLEEVVLNEGLETIGNYAFSYTRRYYATLKRLHIPSTVKNFAKSFFYRCCFLEEFSISEDNPYYVFDGNAIYTKDKKEIVCVFPTFRGVFELDDHCEIVGNESMGAAYGLPELEGVIGKNVRILDREAFCNAYNMEFIALGSRVGRIEPKAFDGCSSLVNIYLGCKDVPSGTYFPDCAWNEINSCTLYVPSSSIEAFKADPFWKQLKAVKPIEDTEYAYLADLGDGSVHKTVTLTEAGTLAELLGDEASNIAHLTIVGPINGVDLGTLRSMLGTESGHSILTHLDMKDASIVKGGEYMPDITLNEDNLLPDRIFSWCKSLQYIVVPNTLERIGSGALEWSSELNEVVLNDGLQTIAENAFTRSAIKVLHIPSTVNNLGSGFIERCDQLTDLSIDAANPYYVCDGKAIYTTGYKTLIVVNPGYSGEYTLNENCQDIGTFALLNDDHITGMVAPSVIKIQYGGFWGAHNLEYLAFGYPLKTIGYYAFTNCNGLKNIYLGCKDVPSGGYAESDADWFDIAECTLYVPASSIELYKADAFWGQMKEVLPIEDTRFAYLCEILAQSIVFDESSVSMFKGETHPLVAHVLPENTSNKMVSWSSSDDTVATVDQNGVVTALKKGTAKITATANDGSGVSNSVTVTVENVTATGIELNYSSYTLEKGETVQLSAAITPDNVEDHSVTWTSSNTDIATVSSNGLVTAKAVGSAIISAKTNDGSNLSATCAVTVEKTMVSSITLSTTNVDLKVAETCQLTATVLPENATNKNVIWSSSNEGVATVTSSGLVNAIAIGDAVIKATAEDGSGVSASAQISVKAVPVTSIALSETYVEIEVGGQYTLTATVNPSNATNKVVFWSSENENVAVVTSSGTVVAVAPGQTIVTATAADGSGVSSSADIVVYNPEVLAESVNFEESSITMFKGETVTLVAIVLPENTTNKSVAWSSNNTTVASVDQNGVVTAKKAGTAKIKATAQDGSGVSGTVTVTVKNVTATDIELNYTSYTLHAGETVQLTATVSPDNTENKSVTWTSSNTSVASVSSSGLVTAKSVGSATITAKTRDGSNLSATCSITVEAIMVSSITLSETYVEMEVGEHFGLEATVNPSNATNKDVVWSSDNENIAMVTSLGTVIALAPGQVKVAATAADGSGVSASATVKVNDILVNNITLNYTSYSLDMNENVQLEATVEPENATNKNLVWTSSDEDVVLVSSSGKVLWMGIGMAVVTATSTDGSNVSASCTFSCINGISTITVDKDSSIRIYTVDGKEVGKLQKGVNIILKADGKSEKVIVE